MTDYPTFTPAQATSRLEAAALALANAVNQHIDAMPREIAHELGVLAIDVFEATLPKNRDKPALGPNPVRPMAFADQLRASVNIARAGGKTHLQVVK
jgi:hypothetical protein